MRNACTHPRIVPHLTEKQWVKAKKEQKNLYDLSENYQIIQKSYVKFHIGSREKVKDDRKQKSKKLEGLDALPTCIDKKGKGEKEQLKEALHGLK